MSTTNWNRDKREDREYFSATERRAVLRRDRFKCYLCGGQATQADHIIPQAEGGSHSPENAGAICAPCHTAKSRDEALRGYKRRQAKLRLPEDPHPFYS